MQEIISLFTGKYGLTKPEVMAEIETVFPSTLSRWYGMDVMAHFREDLQLETVAYNNSGGVIMQQQVDLAEIRGRNTLLKYYIPKKLDTSSVFQEKTITVC